MLQPPQHCRFAQKPLPEGGTIGLLQVAWGQ
jgi:hypothetical protein